MQPVSPLVTALLHCFICAKRNCTIKGSGCSGCSSRPVVSLVAPSKAKKTRLPWSNNVQRRTGQQIPPGAGICICEPNIKFVAKNTTLSLIYPPPPFSIFCRAPQLHKAEPSEGCWNVPMQGQERQKEELEGGGGGGGQTMQKKKKIQIFVNKETGCQI